MDVANRQVAFTGFSTELSLEIRSREIEQYLQKFPDFSRYTIGHFMKGPRGTQTATKASYIEFANESLRKSFLDKAKDVSFASSGGVVRVRAAKTKFNKHRDWALGKAMEVLKGAAPGKAVQADFKNRTVKVDEAKVFEQSSTDFDGVFLPPYANLSLH